MHTVKSWSTQPWIGCISKCLPSRFRDLYRQGVRKNLKSLRWQMTPKKWHLPDTTGLTHRSTHWACDSIHIICMMSSGQKKSQGEHKVSTQEAICNWHMQQEETTVLTNRVTQSIQPHSRQAPSAGETLANTKWTPWFLCVILVWFSLTSFVFWSFCLFAFLF